MPLPGVASLAREDLPLRAVVMLTRTVCSLLHASCLFSRFRRCCFTLHFRPARLQAAESGLKSKVTWSLSNDDGDAEDNA